MPAFERAGRSLPDRSWLKLQPEHRFQAVAIAASAGALHALEQVLTALPADFPLAVLVLTHRSAAPSHLEELVGRRARLPMIRGRPGDCLRPGAVYFAPGGLHTTVGPGGMLSITDGNPIAFARPSASLMFRSIAEVYAERAIGCVLTGMGRDGAAGIAELRRQGGLVIAQRPASSAYPGMPATAIETRKVDLVLELDRIALALCILAGLE